MSESFYEISMLKMCEYDHVSCSLHEISSEWNRYIVKSYSPDNFSNSKQIPECKKYVLLSGGHICSDFI